MNVGRGRLSARNAALQGALALVNALGSAVSGRRLAILIFHRVHAEPDPLFPGEPDAARFTALMHLLAGSFHVSSLADALAALRAGRLARGTLVVTFDDGYADNLDVACPILVGAGIPATFFVASSFMRGGLMWNDRVVEAIRRADGSCAEVGDAVFRALGIQHGGGRDEPGQDEWVRRRLLCGQVLSAIKYWVPEERDRAVAGIEHAIGAARPARLMMDEDQIRTLRARGMSIGGHTATHPILRMLDDDAARAEITRGKADLERVLGEPISTFAYPNGKPGEDYCARDVRLVREAGFSAAVTTAWGVAGTGCDEFQLPRFTPWDRSPWRFGLRLAADLGRRNYATV